MKRAAAVLIVVLLALNLFQFYYFNYMKHRVEEEDVPTAIVALTDPNTQQDYIGKKVTVDGYYFKRGRNSMLVSNPEVLFIDQVDDYRYKTLLLSGEIPTSLEVGSRYYVKGAVQNAGQVQIAGQSNQTSSYQEITLVFQSAKFVETSYLPFIEDAYHFTLHPTAPSPTFRVSQLSYAVLISGGCNPSMAYLRYWNDMKYMYSILVNTYGYEPGHIFVIYKDGVGEDGEIPVDYAATWANIDLVFNTLATTLTTNSALFIYTNNHGGISSLTGESTLCLYSATGGGWEIGASYFAYLLKPITSKTIVFMKQCYSGGFIDYLSAPNRLIMTACTPDQTSWAADTEGNFGEFSYHFMKAVNREVAADADSDGLVSMAEAFNYAASMDSRLETPQYDDNGDHIGHTYLIPNGGDGDLGFWHL
jgi:hypothetical protein